MFRVVVIFAWPRIPWIALGWTSCAIKSEAQQWRRS